MDNTVIFGKEARQKIKEGVDLIANPVKVTLGAKGLNVMCVRDLLLPIITKDGVSVAKEVAGNDPIVNAGASLVKQVASQTNELAGDGPQPLYSKVLTPTGFVNMGDLKEGDEICGTNGTIQKVIGVFPKGQKKIYKLVFSDGRVVECCEDHLWNVTTNYGKNKTLTVKSILESNRIIVGEKHKQYGYYVPSTQVEFIQDGKNLPLDSYLVGLLLGDGSLGKNGSIELSLGFKKEHIINKIVVPEGISFNSRYDDSKNYFRVKFIGKTNDGLSLKDILENLGLLNTKSGTKFIPKNYLYSNLESRKALFQGLIDTDGYINKRGLFEFSTISKQLVLDFSELVRSLGKQLSVSKLIRKENSSYSMTPIFRACERKGFKHGVQLVDIIDTNKYTEMQCIRVSNNDNLYVTDNYIVTHNTTSSTVLAQAIVNEADEVLNTGVNAISLKRGLDLALDFSVQHLKKLAINSKSVKTLKNIAKISTNGDKEISNLVTTAITKVGKNGTIKVEETEDFTSNVVLSKGYEIDSPYVHTGFINSPQTFEAIFEDMNVLIYSGKIKEPSQLNKAIQLCSKELEDGKSEFTGLLVICNHIDPVVQKEILEFSYRGFKFMNITSPSFNNKRLETLKDIAALIGGKVYVEDLGESLNDITLEGLGKIDKVVADANKTVLIGGKGDSKEISERIKVVTEQVKTITGGAKETQFVKERLSKLKNGVAVINVGGYSAVEKREKTDRVEDALCAVRACLDEGYVAGGGVTYLNVAQALKSAKLNTKNQDEQKGVEVLIKALYAPFIQILTNAGINEDAINSLILSINESPYGHGINLETDKFTDLIKEGIIDPAKVSRVALQNAVSISSTFLTMGAITYNSESIFTNPQKMSNI